MADEKKLIIDDDWKQEAKREKEILAEKEQEQGDETQRGPLPPADLSGLISMLATQAFFALGVIRAKEDEAPELDLDMAKFNIDMLGVIENKTQGNLSDEEQRLLQDTLHQLRMIFVQISNAKP